MYRFILIFFLFQTISGHSQRIFSANGMLVSFLNMDIKDGGPVSEYKGLIIRPSICLGFETKQWHRLSLTAAVSNFTSGGKEPSNGDSPYYSYHKMLFDNYCIGVTGNYYMVNKKTQFYFGIGPRLDYVRSERGIYSEWDGTSYVPQYLRKYVFGVSGSIGVNFQLENFILGIKSNYYYRPHLYKSGYENIYSKGSNVIRDNVVDLQLVFGYTLGKKKAN